MLDLKLLEKDFDFVFQRLEIKGVEASLLENLNQLFGEYKQKQQLFEEARALQNKLSKEFPIYKKEGKDVSALKAKLEANKELIAQHQEALREAEEKLNALALSVPNLPDEDVPLGADEEENVELQKVLEPKTFDFEPKPHWELGSALGWLDFEAGVKLAKSRFTVIKKEGARLERALINYMLDFNRSRGFEEVYVPFMVNATALEGTGQLPKFEEDLFKIDDESLYLIPTAEVPLTNLYQDEIIKDLETPIKLTSYTPCFRKEAGSGGRDVRGMIRQHQFDKVEMVCIAKPEESDAVFEQMVSCASDLLTSLGLPHRHMMLCGGDLGFSAAKTVDLEVWIPSQQKYREISSISNTRDFQARRAKIRYKEGKKNTLVHTLNGSSLAVGRTLIAIMENFQDKDGNIAIPDVLQKYL